jgi:hypothetical protein
MPPLNKSKRPSGRRRSKNILIEAEILNDFIGSKKPATPSPTQKNDNFMISMEKRESKMEDLLEETSLISSTRKKAMPPKK